MWVCVPCSRKLSVRRALSHSGGRAAAALSCQRIFILKKKERKRREEEKKKEWREREVAFRHGWESCCTVHPLRASSSSFFFSTTLQSFRCLPFKRSSPVRAPLAAQSSFSRLADRQFSHFRLPFLLSSIRLQKKFYFSNLNFTRRVCVHYAFGPYYLLTAGNLEDGKALLSYSPISA